MCARHGACRSPTQNVNPNMKKCRIEPNWQTLYKINGLDSSKVPPSYSQRKTGTFYTCVSLHAKHDWQAESACCGYRWGGGGPPAACGEDGATASTPLVRLQQHGAHAAGPAGAQAAAVCGGRRPGWQLSCWGLGKMFLHDVCNLFCMFWVVSKFCFQNGISLLALLITNPNLQLWMSLIYLHERVEEEREEIKCLFQSVDPGRKD